MVSVIILLSVITIIIIIIIDNLSVNPSYGLGVLGHYSLYEVPQLTGPSVHPARFPRFLEV